MKSISTHLTKGQLCCYSLEQTFLQITLRWKNVSLLVFYNNIKSPWHVYKSVL